MSKLEIEYQPAFEAWTKDPSKDNMGTMLKTVDPVINNAMRNYATGMVRSPTMKSRARLLAADAFTVTKLYEALDGGILVEPFFVQWANVNVLVGFRSFGAGLGADITTNFGLYLGYALTWGTWRSNPYLGVSFAF